MQTFTIPDLIDKFAEFYTLCPDSRDWDEALLKGNDPRYYRFLQIEALRKAFGVDPFKGLYDFPKAGLSEEEYAIREKYILDKVFDYGTHSREFFEDRGFINLSFVWHVLIEVRMDLQRLLEGPYFIEYPVIGINLFAFLKEKKAPVYQLKDEINEILSFLISPEPLTVTIDTLVKDFNYPEVDMDEIDCDNI